MKMHPSRRGFLTYLGLAGATAATATASIVVADEVAETGPFKHPAEYLAAMQAIGWQPRAMFHPLPDGGVHRMGVVENPKQGVDVMETWEKFHAIQMRAPVQRPADFPPGDWWKAVWLHLYDLGFREDVTPPKYLDRLDEEAKR